MSLVAVALEPPAHVETTTQAKYRSIIRKFNLTTATTWADVTDDVMAIENTNTRRSVIIVLRTLLGREGAPRIPNPVRRVYDLPTEEEIRDRSYGPYQHMIVAMAYAGLRIGEACALKPTDVKKSGSTAWIDVSKSKDNTGRVKQPKSGQGRVVIPMWLYEILKESDYPEILPNSLFKWMKRRKLQPHGLRHWYATYLVREVANVELARRQLRHANLSTTLQTYVEISAQDELSAISGLANPFAA